MYTHKNYQTKKELKLAVASGLQVGYFQPNDMGFKPIPTDGIIIIEGPHYPKPHKWYAECTVKEGFIVKVK